jgi:hypothetical protein
MTPDCVDFYLWSIGAREHSRQFVREKLEPYLERNPHDEHAVLRRYRR